MSPALPEFPANVAQHVMSARGGDGDKGHGHRIGGERKLEVTHELSLEGVGACQRETRRGEDRPGGGSSLSRGTEVGKPLACSGGQIRY